MKVYLLFLPGTEHLRSAIVCRRPAVDTSEEETSWTAPLFPVSSWPEELASHDDDLVFDRHSPWNTIVFGVLPRLSDTVLAAIAHLRTSVTDDGYESIAGEAFTVLSRSGISGVRNHRRIVVQVTEPGAQSTTHSADSRRGVGLHFDNLDRTTIHEKEDAAARLSINVGTEARHFCISPISFKEAHQFNDHFTTSMGRLLKPSELAAAAVRRLRVPIFDIKIPPMMFYVAPTQNLVHDGHTLGRNTIDYAVTCWTNLTFPGETLERN